MSNVTLYRIGPLPSESRTIADKSAAPDWLRDATKSSGQDAALGRWFTSDRTEAKWYAREHPEHVIRTVTVSSADAAKWRAADHPTASRFASNPEHEYFVPADIANKAKPEPAREAGTSYWSARVEQGRASAAGNDTLRERDAGIER